MEKSLREVYELAEKRGWESVKNIASELIAYVEKDVSLFVLEFATVGREIVSVKIKGRLSNRCYTVYGSNSGLNKRTLEEIFDKFLNDSDALAAIQKSLAEEIRNLANKELNQNQ